MDNSSPTNSGPDSEVASVMSDLPPDARKNLDLVPEDLSNKVAAATSYVGSFFNPSAWKQTEKVLDIHVNDNVTRSCVLGFRCSYRRRAN